MKRIFAFVMVLCVLAALFIMPASAAVTPGETKFSAKEGDTIEYILNLKVPEKLVGTDFSIYFKSSELKIVDYADFKGYDEDKQVATMNADLKDQFIFVWTNISGQRMDGNALCKIKFKAQKDLNNAHISYYVRYLYPDSMVQFTDYKFTCTVKVNDKTVIDNKAPELEVGEDQKQGYFVNSVDGNGENANINISGKDDPYNPEEIPTEQPKTEEKEDPTERPTETSEITAPTGEATGDSVDVTDTPAKDKAEDLKKADKDGDNADKSIFQSVWFWIIAVVVMAGLGTGVFFIVKKK